MIEDLTWNNYLEINDYIYENIDFNYVKNPFSTIELIQWKCYGIDLKIHRLSDIVIFYYKNDTNNIYFNDGKPKWNLFTSFYNDDFNLEKAKEIIKSDLFELNGSDEFSIVDFTREQIDDWKLNEYEWTEAKYVSNYIYNLDSLKTFKGKKLVKKRNHLNAFINAKHNVEIRDIKVEDHNVLINFARLLVKKYNVEESQERENGEIESYIKLFESFKADKRFKGTSFILITF